MTNVSAFYDEFLNELPFVSFADVYNRLLSNLPNWFGFRAFADGSVLTTVLMAYVATAINDNISEDNPFFGIYNQLQYILEQMRLGPGQSNFMTDNDQLDLFSQDFFGNTLPRLATPLGPESNSSYKKRIVANLMTVKGNRQSIYDALLSLTGNPPVIFEPWRPLDCGCYGGITSTNYTIGYGNHGLYGSGSYPYQGFIDVYVNQSNSMADYPGYNTVVGCYGGSSSSNTVMWYGGSSLVSDIITNDQIYQVINSTKVFGTIAWVAIHESSEPRAIEIVYDNSLHPFLDNNSQTILD